MCIPHASSRLNEEPEAELLEAPRRSFNLNGFYFITHFVYVRCDCIISAEPLRRVGSGFHRTFPPHFSCAGFRVKYRMFAFLPFNFDKSVLNPLRVFSPVFLVLCSSWLFCFFSLSFQLDDAALQVYKDGDLGAYLDLESSLAEQSEDIEGLNAK